MADEAFVTQQYVQVANTPEPYSLYVTSQYGQVASANAESLYLTALYAQVATSVASTPIASRRAIVVFN